MFENITEVLNNAFETVNSFTSVISALKNEIILLNQKLQEATNVIAQKDIEIKNLKEQLGE